MHAVFIPYGKIEEIEIFFRDLRAQKHVLELKKEYKKISFVIESQLRMLPFGIYEYIFPKEDKDKVLAGLKFHGFEKSQYNINESYIVMLRRILNCEKAGKFDASKKFPWITENVMIIPIGIKQDDEITEDGTKYPNYKGWKHEAI